MKKWLLECFTGERQNALLGLFVGGYAVIIYLLSFFPYLTK
jgi:hypothetical protein